MSCLSIKDLPIPPAGRSGWPWTEGPIWQTAADDMAKGPSITVVTPSFNQGDFIEETIRSVLLQGYANLEYIIIDGNSTDNCRNIIEKYEKWLSFWISEADNGQSEAINKGWKRSRGDILAWLNSDDTYESGALGKVARFFELNPEVDMVYGNCNLVDRYGNFIKSTPTQEFSLKTLVNNKWFIPQQSTFIRRRVYEKIGGLNESLHLVMDWEYWLRVALHQFKIKFLPDVLSNFRFHDHRKTSSQSVKSGEEKIRVLNSIFKDKTFHPIINKFKDGAYSYVYLWTGIRYCRNKRKWRALNCFLRSLVFSPYLIKQKFFQKMIWDCVKSKPSVLNNI